MRKIVELYCTRNGRRDIYSGNDCFCDGNASFFLKTNKNVVDSQYYRSRFNKIFAKELDGWKVANINVECDWDLDDEDEFLDY